MPTAAAVTAPIPSPTAKPTVASVPSPAELLSASRADLEGGTVAELEAVTVVEGDGERCTDIVWAIWCDEAAAGIEELASEV